jgi:transcriptional regulator with XRE-family HTH domain
MGNLNMSKLDRARSMGPESQQRSVYPTLSSAIVRYLRAQGCTLREIGKMLGLSESFISRVSKSQRSFTLDHLVKLEEVIGKALPVILLEATEPSTVPGKLRPVYEAFHNLFAGGRARRTGASERSGREW